MLLRLHSSYYFSISLLLFALATPSILPRLGQLLRHMSATSSPNGGVATAAQQHVSSGAGATVPQNIVVVGASYVGMMAAKELMQKFKGQEGYRVVVVEKQSHFSHLFAFPRFAIVPNHEHKAFVPLSVPSPNLLLRAQVSSITPFSTLLLDRPVALDNRSTTEIPFAALVLASGTKLTPPGTMPSEDKKGGVEYLRGVQQRLKEAQNIVILGGGAVGVQMATDLAIVYPSKLITVVQSRTLMPRFHPNLHELCMKRFGELGIKTVLGSRAIIPEGGFNVTEGPQFVKTVKGEEIEADYVIESTGQTPNSEYIATLAPSALTASKYVRVNSTLQVNPTADEKVRDVTSKIFALGDIADSGAPKAARPGMAQATIVASNVEKLLLGEPASSFETYHPDPAGIHLTLGIIESVIFRNPKSTDPNDLVGSFEGEPVIMHKDDGREDMGVEGVWERRAPGLVKNPEDYWL